MDSVLHLGDCVEVMRSFPDKSFDTVITDPPYGNNTGYSDYDDSRENLALLVAAFMPEALRVAKRVVVTPGVRNIYLYPEYTWILSWVNMAGVGSSSWGFACWQPILVYGKDPYLQSGRGRRPDTFVQTQNQVAKVDHPCPKPTNVMKWIIERTTNPGESILDPFTGSGTTGVACVGMGRKFTGIELAPSYYEIAKSRITDAEQQPILGL